MATRKKTTSPPATLLQPTPEDQHVLVRVVLLSSVLLGLSLTILHTLLAGLATDSPTWLNGLRTGLGLLVFWLFVTAAVRGLHRLRPRIPYPWLVVSGLGTAVLGILVFLVAIRLYAQAWPNAGELPRYRIIGFYTAAGLLASLFALIHLRVTNKRLGNALELLLLAAAVLVFFWIA